MRIIQIGIDLGTTNTLVYGKIDGKIKPVKFNGNVTLPSVMFVEEDGSIIIGRKAKQKENADPHNGIHSSKTFIGLKVKDESGNYSEKEWVIRGQKFNPTDVAAHILSEVRKGVMKKYLLTEDDVIQAVITIPAYFTSNQSDETKKAGERAGLEVLRVITEPVAAAYNINPQDNSLICVIDLGGGTFDVSVVNKQKEKYSVMGIDGDPRLGGDDFDKALEEYFLNDIQDDIGIDLSSLEKSGLSYEQYYRMKSLIRQEAILCKEELSDNDEYEVIINDLFTYGNNKIYHYDTKIVTRDEFDRVCSGLYKKIMDVVKRLIENNSKFRKSDINHVYLVGGSCYIPKIRQIIEDYFGMPVNTEGGLEEQVAQGAAKIAEGYNNPAVGKDGDPLGDRIEDITAHSMGVSIIGGRYSEIIPAGTHYPCTISDTFTTSCDNQEEVIIEVYEKTNKSAANIIDRYESNFELYGSFILGGIEKAKAGKPQINVTFNYDQSRTLHVTAEDEKTGVSKTVTLKKGEIVNAVSVKPTDIFILMDISGSMNNKERMKQAKFACSKLIAETLNLNIHRMGIITFGDEAKVVCNLTHDRNELLAAVDGIYTSGATNMKDAIIEADKLLMNSKNTRAMIIITDGSPYTRTHGNENEKKITLDCVTRAKMHDISVATIGVQDADDSFLNKVSSGGDLSFMVNDVSKLADTFGQAVQNLLSK